MHSEKSIKFTSIFHFNRKCYSNIIYYSLIIPSRFIQSIKCHFKYKVEDPANKFLEIFDDFSHV